MMTPEGHPPTARMMSEGMGDEYAQAQRAEAMPADRETQMAEAQKRLDYATTRLGNTVDELAVRLRAVLRPEAEDGDSATTADVHLVRAPLAQFVVDHADHVLRSDRQLQELLARLEL